MMPIKSFTLILLTVLALSLGGCVGASSSLSSRHATAMKIAGHAAMTERVISAGIFNLTTWERIAMPDAPMNIYIEGDGLAWLNPHTKSMNPTPPDPLALRLAAEDKADNVVYMARPCQYSGLIQNPPRHGACPDLYWTTGRTAAEVIRSYNQALDDIKSLHRTSGFNLIGYSGGAAVAVLVAAERADILSLRTVAGNTDYTRFTALHNISPMEASLNPVDVATKLTRLPQRHFIGGKDKIVPSVIFESWKRASGDTACIQSVIVPDVTHEKFWVEKWPTLLATPPECAALKPPPTK